MKKFVSFLIVFMCIITLSVTSHSKDAYESGDIITLYSPDGSTKQVNSNYAEKEIQNGWYTQPVCRMYAPDGRSKMVYKANIEAEQSVGWYTQPVCKMYAYDGREKIVKLSNVENELKVGWHLSMAKAVFSTYPYRRIKVLNIFLNKDKDSGVEVCVCWRNDSGKTIDHITFELTPSDKTGGVEKCSKTNISTKHLRVSQNIESFNESNVKQGYIFHNGLLRYVTKDNDGCFNYNIYKDNGNVEKYTLSTYDKAHLINNLHYWSHVWYNENIQKVTVNSIRVKYSDGTFDVIQNPTIWKDIFEEL